MREPIPITTQEVARILRVSPDRARQLAREGALVPTITLAGGTRLFDRHAIMRFARERLREKYAQQLALEAARREAKS